MISRIPGVQLYTQYPAWADERWHYRGAVFDSFVPSEEPRATRGELRKVVVSLGTFKDYGFERLVRRLLDILPPNAEVLWQTGDTDVSGLGIAGHHAIPERELIRAIDEADVLVAHAGVGTALAALEVGRCPVLVPRRWRTASTSTITRSRSRASSTDAGSHSPSKRTTSRSITCWKRRRAR